MRDQESGNVQLGRDPQWYKDAVIYELHVRTFSDSDGDGIGDFRGLIRKLDYLQALGVSAIWLLPFYPSPLKDEGYDVADYCNVHPSYGTLRDVRQFIREAHNRGLRVVTEMVCNHTSDQHPWFQQARLAKPGDSLRDWYVWSDTADKYKDARIVFKDFEAANWTWDSVAGAYYWHRFYSHQPDLNYENPAVHEAIRKVVSFWLKAGVDGLRLDAVPYLYEQEDTDCENLPQTHAFLKSLRQFVDEHFPDRMLLAEANLWPEHAIHYFGGGDECHMAFHFPLMPRLFLGLRMEDRFPITDVLGQTPLIPESCQWALFLRNHDELTLETVTDEERAFMYREYAMDPQMRMNLGIRRRLAPLLGNHRRRIELLKGLLFSLPGTPVLYYGDEIGMGDNIYLGDRNAVRTPMQWSADRNAGFSSANRQQLALPVVVDPEYHYESVNVEAQEKNPHSLLWWMRRLIALRRQHPAFGRGSLEFLHPENRSILAFIRRYGDELILVVANLSRFVQPAELDLSAFRGLVPFELFGRVEFPPVGDRPYFFTLGPHSFYWFSLERAEAPRERTSLQPADPALPIRGGWEGIGRREFRAQLARTLPAYLSRRPWFAGVARHVKAATVTDVVPVGNGGLRAAIAITQVEYSDQEPERYVIPLALATGSEAEQVVSLFPEDVVTRVQLPGESGILYDALHVPRFARALLEAASRRRQLRGGCGSIVGTASMRLRQLQDSAEPVLGQDDHGDGAVIFGNDLVLRLLRRTEPGINLDVELGGFLTERARFAGIAGLAGSLTYEPEQGEPITLALLREFATGGVNGRQHGLHAVEQFLVENVGRPAERRVPLLPENGPLLLAASEIPPLVQETLGAYAPLSERLGARTGELHLALAAAREPDLAPEPFNLHYQQALAHSMLGLTRKTLQTLAQALSALPEAAQGVARQVLDRQHQIEAVMQALGERPFSGLRIRCHGAYSLEHVVVQGSSVVIAGFTGTPTRDQRNRRWKRSPLCDVANMLYSFHSVACTALSALTAGGVSLPGGALPEPWARFWETWVSASYLRAYLQTTAKGPLRQRDRREAAVLLNAYFAETALWELQHHLDHQADLAPIPLTALLTLLQVVR